MRVPYAIAHPHNEAIEQFDGDKCSYRILYRGTEIATLSYAESYEVAELYAAAPSLLAACIEAREFLCQIVGEPTHEGRQRIISQGWPAMNEKLRAAREKAKGGRS